MRSRKSAKGDLSFATALAVDLRRMDEEPDEKASRAGRARWRRHAAALEAYVADHAPSAVATIDVDDTSGLPPALLKELSATDGDALEMQIVAVFRALGGTADLDRLLIGLYRMFEIVQKRRFVQNKIWRMVRKGILGKVVGKRGVFRVAGPQKRARRGK